MTSAKVFSLVLLLNIIFVTSISSHKVICPPPTPSRSPPPSPSRSPSVPNKLAKCPKDTLKFGVCGDWLGLVHEVIEAKPSAKCCALLKGLADLEAALCLCTAIKANVLGVVNVKAPVAISLLVNSCGKKVPDGFVCA